MNTDGGKIWYASGLDTSDLQNDANRAKAIFKDIANSAKEQGEKAQGSFSEIGKGITMIGGTAAIGMLGKEILDVTAKFEKFGIVLRNTLGDTKGTEALAMIANFAATTPFQLDEVTGSFIKMANQGFVPTQEQMIKLGDLASSTGKSFDQLTEALLDAQTGEFERLKEFGIKASANGDKVTFSFKEQKTTVENTNGAIQAYILSLGTLKGVSGANALISASLTGQISNLQDKLSMMFNDLGTANKGILYEVVGGAAQLIDNYKLVGEMVAALVTEYGIYKVAVMAVAYQENANMVAKVRNTAIEKVMASDLLMIESLSDSMAASRGGKEVLIANARIAATQRVIAAEEELAVVSKESALANPYVLAAMAVAALGFAIYKVVTYQSDLDKAIEKTNIQIENERDKAAGLFAELQHTAEGTDEWKKAKQSILDQYGKYLTSQEQEALGLKNLEEIRKKVNLGIEESIALKVKEQTLAGISDQYNGKITSATKKIVDIVKDEKGGQQAAYVNQDLSAAVGAYKYAVTPAEIEAAGKKLDELQKQIFADTGSGRANELFRWLRGQIDGMKEATAEATAGFNQFAQAKAASASKDKAPDPVLTTYAAQRKLLEDRKKALEAQLEKAKATPGVDPTKTVTDIQGKIDEVNKQLGVKDTKEKLTQIEKIKKAMETAQGRELYLLTHKLAKLEEIKKIQEEIASGAMMKGVNDSGATAYDPNALDGTSGLKSKLSSKVSSGILKEFTDSIDPLAKKQDANNLKEIDRAKEKMRLSNDAYQKEKDHQQWLFDDKKDKDEKEKQRVEERANALYQIADAFSSIAGKIGDSNKPLADMINGVGQLANEMGNLVKAGAFSKEGMSKSSAISATISGATSLIGLVAGQAAENKRVMNEYYASIIKQQQDYNLLLNDQLLINSSIKGSVFIKDYEGSLTDSTAAYNDAQKKLAEEQKKFLSSEAIVGKKSVVSGANVLSGVAAGAAVGAGVGSIVPVVGTVVGAAIGAAVGLFTGLFAKKKKDVVAPLLDTYPDLIKANGEFNADLAKTLITNNKVTDATKATLQNMIDWKEAADKATAQLKSVISDLTGSLGDDLRNSLVDAFKAGTDAAEAFKGSVNKVLENIMSNMIFNKAFEGAFKTLEDAMAASYAVGGDQSWLDDFQKFYSQSPELIKTFNQGMSDAQTAAAGAGLSIFSSTKAESTRTATTTGITSLSQETGNEMNGRFTVIQGHTFRLAEGMDILRANSAQTLKYLAGIEANTDYCKRLEAIDGNIKKVSEGIDIITLKGITLKQ